MTNLKSLNDWASFIPSHKSDDKAIEILENSSIEEIKPFVYHLLLWCSDINWPVAGLIINWFIENAVHIAPEITELFSFDEEYFLEFKSRKIEDEYTFIYYVLCNVIDNSDLELYREYLSKVSNYVIGPKILNNSLKESCKNIAVELLNQLNTNSAEYN